MKEKSIDHCLFTVDLVKYNFNDIEKTFKISYFSKDIDLLSDKFMDSHNLKDYESVEKATEDNIRILVKKFKLILNFTKNHDFSREVVISDDWEFNPNMLRYSDLLVKIAIINEDNDKWINSGNLSNYDYIFTLDKYSYSFKEQKNIFIIDDETTYEQIKYVLNELSRNDAKKFSNFIKSISFNNVFPTKENYFDILNSEYFEDEWYRNEYNLNNNTDSVFHYLLIGFKKGCNPGHNFNSQEYYKCNFDVKKIGMNPLVHYELYGKEENRLINSSDLPKRNYSAIVDSPFFDEEWYRATYDIDGDVDCVDHYLNVGYTRGFNPGPDFSTYVYWQCNMDIKEEGMNPLLHYELYGRKENRSFKFDWEVRAYSAIADSPFFDEEWYKSTYDLSDVDCVDHYLNIGYAKGYNPGPGFDSFEYWKSNEDVKEYGMNPLAHYELYGRKENRMIFLSEMIERDYLAISDSPYFDELWYRSTYDLDVDVDCVDHYLNVGYAKGFNPGPDFSTYVYWECNSDIKDWKMNPLLHYELYGRKENRVFQFDDGRAQRGYSAIVDSPFFDEEWYRTTYDIGLGVDCVNHYLNIGYAKGYNPGPDFDSFEYWDCNEDVKEYGMNPLAHYEIYGRREKRNISLSDADKE